MLFRSERFTNASGMVLYFDRIPLAFVNRSIQKDGIHAIEQVADATTAPGIFLSTGGRVTAPLTSIAPSIFVSDPAFVTPYSIQTNTSIERLVSKDVTVRADYLFTRGIHLLRTRNANLAPPILFSDNARPVFGPGRIDPRLTPFTAWRVHLRPRITASHGV